jgi:hypothetical protein
MNDTPPVTPEAAPRKGFLERLKTSRFLLISILFHALLIVVAGLLVVQVITKRKQTFVAAPPAPQNRAVEHKVQMAKKQQSMSAPMTKRVVTTGLSKVALPEMPDLAAVADASNPMAATAAGAGPGIGLGTSMSGGGDSGVGGGVPLFGLRRGVGLEGTFFDLKQSPARRPTQKWNEKDYRNKMESFARQNLNSSYLNRYYQGKNKLYTSQIMMPRIPANEGPKGFGVENEVAPSYWAVVYRAKVSPPQSGVYHFVGASDDVMAVKFNGRIVMDGSLYHGLGEWKAKKEYNYANYTRDIFLKKYNAGGWAYGDAMNVEAGKWYDLVVMIGEAPGGFFDASLLIEKEGVTYEKDDRGNPILPPFRVSNVQVTPADGLPPYAKDGPIWKSKPSGDGLSLLDAN